MPCTRSTGHGGVLVSICNSYAGGPRFEFSLRLAVLTIISWLLLVLPSNG